MGGETPTIKFCSMKRKLTLVFLTLVFASTYGQEVKHWLAMKRMPEELVSIDSCTLRVKYRYDYYLDCERQYPNHDIMILDIGKSNITRQWSYYGAICDSIAFRARVEGLEAVNTTKWMDNTQWPITEDFFRNYPAKGQSTLQFSIINQDYFYIEENPTQNWQLLGDTLTIAGYKCYNAKAKFRGREYSVWFTPEIPYSYGPWKLASLPGLILRAEDSEDFFKWEVISVKQYNGAMYAYDKETRRETSYKNYHKLMRLRWKDPNLLSNSQGVPVMSYDPSTGKLAKAGQPTYPEIPQLEIE